MRKSLYFQRRPFVPSSSVSTVVSRHAVKPNVVLPRHVQAEAAAAPALSRKERKKKDWLKRKAKWNEGDRREKSYQGHWEELPVLVLEHIFQYLSLNDKMSASLVCTHWGRIVYSCFIWTDFVINDHFMTKYRYNYAGRFYEEVLDSIKASRVMNKLLTRARRMWLLPKKNLHVVCGLQTMITRWCQMYGQLDNIRSFTYIFPCDFARKSNETDIYGTGGTILEEMKELLLYMPNLRRLELIDLELEMIDASHVLDEVSGICDSRLTTLKIINISRQPYEMLAVAGFVNLQHLFISPHNIGPDLVTCFGDMKPLRNVVLTINSHTDCVQIPVDRRVWMAMRKNNPHLRVHLLSEGKKTKEILFQPGAPVKSIVFDSTHLKTSAFTLYAAVELYRSDLECVAFCRLPRYFMPKAFHERADAAYLQVIKQCPYIHTLMIKERLSSASVLLLAHAGKNLRYFYVRRNAIMLKCDWPKNPDWDWAFYKWLQISSRSYESLEREVSALLGFRWYALNDKQFKLTQINVTMEYYRDGYNPSASS